MKTHAMTRHAYLLVAALAFLMINGCQKGGGEFVEFRDFITQTQNAAFSDYAGKPNVRVADEAAFNEMKQHLLQLYQGVIPEHSFLINDREYVDCVPVEQQPGARGKRVEIEPKQKVEPKASAEQKKTSQQTLPPGNQLDITLQSGKRDRFGHEMACRENYIPFRRLTLQELTRFRTLGDFFNKFGGRSFSHGSGFGSREGNEPGINQHYEVYGRRDVTNFGGDSWLNVWNPQVASDSEFSLSQIWIAGGDGAALQTAETGWQVAPNRYGRKEASLFIYYTTANYDPKKPGCYNLDCSAFVQVTNKICIGCGFSNYSSTGQTQWGFNLHWQMSAQGDWWLFYKGPGDYIAVGYYPNGAYGGGVLSRSASLVAFGGETTGSRSALQMGSGELPSAGWQKAAFQKRIFYLDSVTSAQWTDLSTKLETDPSCYKVDITNLSGPDWETYLFFGGPKCN